MEPIWVLFGYLFIVPLAVAGTVSVMLTAGISRRRRH